MDECHESPKYYCADIIVRETFGAPKSTSPSWGMRGSAIGQRGGRAVWKVNDLKCWALEGILN